MRIIRRRRRFCITYAITNNRGSLGGKQGRFDWIPFQVLLLAIKEEPYLVHPNI